MRASSARLRFRDVNHNGQCAGVVSIVDDGADRHVGMDQHSVFPDEYEIVFFYDTLFAQFEQGQANIDGLPAHERLEGASEHFLREYIQVSPPFWD